MGSIARFRRPLLFVMSAFYVVAGVAHLLWPRGFQRVVPPSLPRPRLVVYVSGVAELVLGAGVLVRRTRRVSAWGLVALLVAVFPANVHVARSDVFRDAVPSRFSWLVDVAAWARLPVQAVLVLWAWWYTRPDD
ncbi:DoxX family membrane protein [Salarchaeum sp. JOR-1]|uniref:DoxX family protein n=1 Tax=Salarchaeum sp. JOR-1 TaxID=2599399 RepID=UPI0011985CF2|nr:DoxX family membrane protein [Salarchaeum sp. JOR-1]QDX39980.1 DoxX family membrane protein [Salarchaeum sp. JOR-1]